MMNKFLKKLLGFNTLEENIAEATKIKDEALKIKEEAQAALDSAKEVERIANLSPKEIATEKKEPWVAVLNTHVNADNIRNGFFELDWNEYFVLQLRTAGYLGENDEAVVDEWFTELCRNVGGEEGVDMSRRASGFINVNNLGNGKTEVS